MLLHVNHAGSPRDSTPLVPPFVSTLSFSSTRLKPELIYNLKSSFYFTLCYVILPYYHRTCGRRNDASFTREKPNKQNFAFGVLPFTSTLWHVEREREGEREGERERERERERESERERE